MHNDLKIKDAQIDYEMHHIQIEISTQIKKLTQRIHQYLDRKLSSDFLREFIESYMINKHYEKLMDKPLDMSEDILYLDVPKAIKELNIHDVVKELGLLIGLSIEYHQNNTVIIRSKRHYFDEVHSDMLLKTITDKLNQALKSFHSKI